MLLELGRCGHDQVNDGSLTEVRQQLEEILACSFFRTSTRCSRMLRYVVEYSLEHPGGSLKERTVGSDVFDREPDYDTSGDPVVRATAGEIRKRFAQFYAQHSRATLFISLLPGSYLPAITVARSGQNGYPDPAQDRLPQITMDRLRTRRLRMFSHPLEL
jgi:hypothetical protein